MKRALDKNISSRTRSKRPKLCDYKLDEVFTRNDKYISATKIKNYMIDDPLVDWLKVHKNKQLKKKKKHEKQNKNNKPDNEFMQYIAEKGIEFEKKVIEYIKENIESVVSVSEYITNDSVNKTIALMKAGAPIIHSAPVRNKKNKTHGIIDLLVRSDYLHKLVDECHLSNEEQIISSPKLGHDFHYVVIDIKFSTLPLKADGVHLLNSGNYKAYKAQCLIYTDAIGCIQGYTSPYAFILGRRWRCKRHGITLNDLTCLNQLGVINYKKWDKKYIQKTKNAVQWIKDNAKYGHTWSISPPSREELYPNMCHDAGIWQKHKEQIAYDIGDITTVWYCGIKHRKIGMENGIYSWRDPECTSDSIGMNGVRAHIIDDILDINRQNVDKIRPEKISHNVNNWKNIGNEMFVDFETLADIFSPLSDLPKQVNTDMIFMIGVWYKKIRSCKRNVKHKLCAPKWEYKRFTAKNTTYEEEYRIMDMFNKFVKKQNNPKLWYWCADKRFWIKSEKRQYDRAINNNMRGRCRNISNWTMEWTDLCDLFKNTPIVIKECFKYSLKPIAKAMKKHGLISTQIESECASGMVAMVNAWKCYQDDEDPVNCAVMKDIAMYNKFDVSVLEDMLTYLRKNHT